MFEWMHRIGWQAIKDYGLLGLFAFSFASATIFVPVSVEWTFPLLIMSGVSKVSILVVATLGAIFGALVNYYVGSGGMNLTKKYVNEKDFKKAHNIMNKYGWFGLFWALILPLPGDPLTVLCGAAKMNISEFTLVVTAAKALKYAAILGLLSFIL
jgi:membrane protein YqaA with SNARE-associated domain